MSAASGNKANDAIENNPARSSRRKNKQKTNEQSASQESQDDLQDKLDHPPQNMDKEKNKENKSHGKKADKTSEDPLLIRMREIMEDTLKVSLGQLKLDLTQKIDDLSVTNKESIDKLRGEVREKFKYLEDKMKTHNDKIEDVLPKVENRLTLLEGKQGTHHLRIKELGDKTQSIEASLEYQTKEFNENKMDLDELRRKTDAQGVQIEKLISENALLRGQVNTLTEGQNILDNKQRKYNLVLEGVNETKGEDVRQLANDLITKASDDEGIKKEVDSVYRIGKKTSGKSRPIIVTFKNLETRDLVLSKASVIKKGSNNRKLWINKDLTDTTRQRSSAVRKCYNRLKDHKQKCQMQGATIKLNGTDYGYNDLDKLPEGFKPSDCQTLAYDDNSMCFAGPKAYYSNFYPAPLRYQSRFFVSSEQAFQWRKANFHKDTEAERKILETSDPYKIKKEGSLVENSDNWKLEEETILYEIVKEKFLQNRDLLRKLLNEQYSNYYECTSDTKWGCGFKLDAIDLDPETIRGKNRFGIILADLKRELADRK